MSIMMKDDGKRQHETLKINFFKIESLYNKEKRLISGIELYSQMYKRPPKNIQELKDTGYLINEFTEDNNFNGTMSFEIDKIRQNVSIKQYIPDEIIRKYYLNHYKSAEYGNLPVDKTNGITLHSYNLNLKTTNALLKKNCNEILEEDPTSKTGFYNILPKLETTQYQVFCNMNVDDGGWTRIHKLDISKTDKNYEDEELIYNLNDENNNDITNEEIKYKRVAYLLELDDEYMWVSFKANKNNDIKKLGLPVNYIKESIIEDVNIITNSSNSSLNGLKNAKGNIEFYPNEYESGSDNKFNNNDDIVNTNKYGSMQIFKDEEVLFSYNGWMSSSTDDIGIGNNSDSTYLDWTAARNISDKNIKTLSVFIK
jgi:hypothetical protein